MSELLTLFTRAHKLLRAAADEAMSRHGVRVGQNLVLAVLWETDGLTPGELAGRLHLTTPTIVNTATRMEDAGLLTRGSRPRRRAARTALPHRTRPRRAAPGRGGTPAAGAAGHGDAHGRGAPPPAQRAHQDHQGDGGRRSGGVIRRCPPVRCRRERATPRPDRPAVAAGGRRDPADGSDRRPGPDAARRPAHRLGGRRARGVGRDPLLRHVRRLGPGRPGVRLRRDGLPADAGRAVRPRARASRAPAAARLAPGRHLGLRALAQADRGAVRDGRTRSRVPARQAQPLRHRHRPSPLPRRRGRPADGRLAPPPQVGPGPHPRLVHPARHGGGALPRPGRTGPPARGPPQRRRRPAAHRLDPRPRRRGGRRGCVRRRRGRPPGKGGRREGPGRAARAAAQDHVGGSRAPPPAGAARERRAPAGHRDRTPRHTAGPAWARWPRSAPTSH